MKWWIRNLAVNSCTLNSKPTEVCSGLHSQLSLPLTQESSSGWWRLYSLPTCTKHMTGLWAWQECMVGWCLKAFHRLSSVEVCLFTIQAMSTIKISLIFFPFKAVFKKKDHYNFFVLIEICRVKEENDGWPACLSYNALRIPEFCGKRTVVTL